MEEIDKELGIVIGTDEEVMWNEVIQSTKIELEKLQKLYVFQTAILEMAQNKLSKANETK